MRLIVTAHTADGSASHQLSSPETALEKARALAAEGHEDIVITDINGRDYAPAEFDRLFVNQGT